MFFIKWPAGQEDYLPNDFFVSGEKPRNLPHDWLWKGKWYTAKCKISVSDSKAELNYAGPNTDFNQKHWVEAGIAKLTFADDSYATITDYEWKPSGSEHSYSPIEIRNDDLIEDVEGNSKIYSHIRFERSSKLRKAKLRNNPAPKCEACNFLFKDKYRELGEGFCEVHHKEPLNKGKRSSKLACLALLCSNCHRMIHKTTKLNQNKEIMSVKQFAAYIKKDK